MIKTVILYLQEKPLVGVAGGAGGWFIAFVEHSSKALGAISGLLGIAVAVLTGISKVIEIRNNLKSYKKP